MKILIFNSNEKSRLVVGQLMKELSFSVSLAEDKNKMMQELKSDTLPMISLLPKKLVCASSSVLISAMRR